MASLFKRLRRGIKLLKEHLYTPISEALALLTTTGVTQDRMERPYGSFRINFYLPAYTRKMKSTDTAFPFEKGNMAVMPFVLPPLQEYVDSRLGPDTSTRPVFVLDEVSISSDSRCEPKNLRDYWTTSTGALTVGGVTEGAEGQFAENFASFGYSLIIYSHVMTPGRAAQTACNEVVHKLDIDAAALNQAVLRLNPYVQSGINLVMDPKKSYMAEIRSTTGATFISMMMSLKFKQELVERDHDAAVIQNLPALRGFTPTPVTITAPTKNTPIDAIGATGIHTMLNAADTVIRNKLMGGYTKRSEKHPGENLKDNACYEMIAVNLFNNNYCVRGGSPAVEDDAWNCTALPYITGLNDRSETIDRRIIPLQYPMTIHGVFAVANAGVLCNMDAPTFRTARWATSTNFYNTIGVGLMAGIRSDTHTYQQVAHLDYTPAFVGRYAIDNVAENGGAGGYMYEILQVPLMGTGGSPFLPNSAYTGAGGTYGHPVFAGQTNSDLVARTNIAGGAPATGGQEQALEVRWSMKDTSAAGGGASLGGMGDLVNWPNNETIVGYGGHWVFIYGKKHLL